MRVKRRAPLQGDFLVPGAKASPTLSTSTTSAYYTHTKSSSEQVPSSEQSGSKPLSQPASTQNLNSLPIVTETQPSVTPTTLRPDSGSSRMHVLQMDIKEYLNKSAGVVDKIRHSNPSSHPFRALSETTTGSPALSADSCSSSSTLAAKRGFWRRQNSAFVTSAMPAPDRSQDHCLSKERPHNVENDPSIGYSKRNSLASGLSNTVTNRHDSEVQTNRNSSEIPKEESTTKMKRSGSVRLRLKRFSMESVEHTARTFNRLSLSSVKLRRTSTNKAVISGAPHSNDLALISSQRTREYGAQNPQSFWKYHVIGFGNGLILATNPTATQDGCRVGPGYHVEIEYNDRSNLATGFKLIFRRLIHVSDDSQPPVLTIIKKSDGEGGYFTVSVQRNSVLNPKTSLIDYHDDDYLYHDFSIGENYRSQEQLKNKAVYHGLVFPKGIPNKYLVSSSQNLVDSRAEESLPTTFKNYEFKDFNNIKWSVGAIPRVKLSKRPRIRDRLFVPQYKYVNPNFSYFHQNYIEEEDFLETQDDDNESIMTMTSKTTLSSNFHPKNQYKYKEQKNPQNVYFQGTKGEAEFPPVLAVFRPKEKSYKRKQILKSINRKFQSPMYAHERGSRASIDVNSMHGDNDMDNDDFDTRSLRTVRSSIYGGDGLYDDNSKDDEPENTKYGWITVYEDRDIFCKNKGMFDVVVGLTFAAGFDKLAAAYNV